MDKKEAVKRLLEAWADGNTSSRLKDIESNKKGSFTVNERDLSYRQKEQLVSLIANVTAVRASLTSAMAVPR